MKLYPKMVGHLEAMQKKYTLKSTDVSVFLDVRNTLTKTHYSLGDFKTDELCVWWCGGGGCDGGVKQS